MCQRCAPTTTTCGVCGRASRTALAALGDRPAVGRCCYQPPVAVCSQCEDERPCHHADTDRPVCLACAPRRLGECGVCGRVSRIARRATDSSPQVGICCYRLPLATCIDCGRVRPCYWAKTDEPVCPSCTAVRRAPVCVGCGQRRVAQRRVDSGILCQTCDIKHGYTTATCHGCGQTEPLTSGVCAACKLRARSISSPRASTQRSRRRSARSCGSSPDRRTRARHCGSSTPPGSRSPAGCSPARSRSVTRDWTRPLSTRRTRSSSSARGSSQPARSTLATKPAPGSPPGRPRRCCGSGPGAIARMSAPMQRGRSRISSRTRCGAVASRVNRRASTRGRW
jgi:hypothetical protein